MPAWASQQCGHPRGPLGQSTVVATSRSGRAKRLVKVLKRLVVVVVMAVTLMAVAIGFMESEQARGP